MKVSNLGHNKNGFFDGPLLLEPTIFSDNRGVFSETWNFSLFNKIVGSEICFVQDNQSLSKKGVLRGMHFQKTPNDQGKLVRCVKGSVFDVIVDLRKSSKTFKLWGGINLSSHNSLQLWIPPGFAHGFLSLEENTLFEYKVTQYWSKESERTLDWKDEKIGIKWPLSGIKVFLSDKDLKGDTFENLRKNNEIFL